MIIKECVKCGAEFISKDGNRQLYCSRSCACTVNNKLKGARSLETKQKIAKALTIIEYRDCKICSNTFLIKRTHPHTKTCSEICSRKLAKLSYEQNRKNHKPMGGLRLRSGRGKSGYYRGFYLNSTYELAYVIYCLDHGIKIKRNTVGYRYYDPDRNGYFTYYPDFIVESRLVEIKGFRSNLDTYKVNSVPDPIQILYKSDLINVFDYVIKITNMKIEDIHALYEI